MSADKINDLLKSIKNDNDLLVAVRDKCDVLINENKIKIKNDRIVKTLKLKTFKLISYNCQSADYHVHSGMKFKIGNVIIDRSYDGDNEGSGETNIWINDKIITDFGDECDNYEDLEESSKNIVDSNAKTIKMSGKHFYEIILKCINEIIKK